MTREWDHADIRYVRRKYANRTGHMHRATWGQVVVERPWWLDFCPIPSLPGITVNPIYANWILEIEHYCHHTHVVSWKSTSFFFCLKEPNKERMNLTRIDNIYGLSGMQRKNANSLWRTRNSLWIMQVNAWQGIVWRFTQQISLF